jgi:hypothetical protein
VQPVRKWAPVKLFPKQEEAVRAIFRSLVTYFIAAWGTGKSVAIAYAAWLLVMRYAPGVDGCFVAPTMGQLLRTLVKAWVKVADPNYYRLVKSGPEPRIEWFGGTPCTIYLFSGDAEERIEGPTLGWAAMEEMQDLKRSVVDRLTGRLRDAAIPQPRLFGAGLPETGTHLHQDLVVKPVQGIRWVKGKTTDNPWNPAWYPEMLRRRLSTNRFRSMVLGEFAAPAGLVHPEFSRDKHVKPCPFERGRRVIAGIDFNRQPYIPAVLYQEHPELDETWGIGEIVLPDSHTRGLAAALIKWCQAREIDWRDPEQIILVPDATGKGESENDGSSCHQTLRDAGFWLDVPEANPAVDSRDNAVSSRLETADGVPHLFFDPSCTTTIAGFEALKHEGRKRSYYVHVLDAAGYPIHRYHPVSEGDFDAWAEAMRELKGERADSPLITIPTVSDWQSL